MYKKLFIIAGEPSGDFHAANLIKAILSKNQNIRFLGMGGELMKAAGAVLYYNIGRISVIGFSEVINKLALYKKIAVDLASKLIYEKPDAVILVDYPGFNIPFAKLAKKINIPVIYYISPQVWAWDQGRIEILKSVVDKMLVFFKFEKTLYEKHSMNVSFVGHPLVETVKTSMSKENALKHFGLNPQGKIIALLPGSRKTEVAKVLPIMLKTCCRLRSVNGDTQFILIKSPIISDSIYEKILKKSNLKINIISQKRHDAVSCADFALVASGTATLETAMLKVPMALVYKVSFITWLIARLLIRIPYIGLVNIVAGEKIVPEFIQFGARPKKIAGECLKILQSPAVLSEMRNKLSGLKFSLGPEGASSNAANEVLKFLN